MDLKRKTILRIRSEAVPDTVLRTSRSHPRWPLAVNAALTVLVVVVAFQAAGGFGWIRARWPAAGPGTGTETSDPYIVPTAARNPVTRFTKPGSELDEAYWGIQINSEGICFSCVDNFYTLSMSSRRGLEFVAAMGRDLESQGKLLYEVLASSGSIVSQEIPPQVDIDSKYGIMTVLGYEVTYDRQYIWSPFNDSDIVPEPTADMAVTINAYLESDDGRELVGSLSIPIQYNDNMYYFDNQGITMNIGDVN